MGDSSEPGFELERVVAVDGRVRVSGWWHGVRGRRFIRPSLRAVGARSRTRALAELEHKPWAATEDGRPWLAEFVWQDSLDGVEALELAVAPDLAVRIPAPGGAAPAGEAARPGRSVEAIVERPKDRRGPEMARRRGVGAPGQRTRPRVDAPRSETLRLASVEQQRDRALAAREEAIAERDRLAELYGQSVVERERLLEELARASKAVAERDEAASENRRLRDARDRVASERDEARRLRERAEAERDVLAGERDEARLRQERAEAERDALAGERDALLSERERLIQARDQARAERNGLLAQHAKQAPERERLARECERALALCDEMATERDRHRDARDEAVAERDRTMGQLEHVRRERDEALADVRRLSGEAERLARERNQRAAEVGTGSEPSAAYEAVQAEADVRPLRGRLEQTATSSTHPRGAVGELESPPSPRPPAAPDHIDATHRLLARAAAVSGIVIAILIVVALVVLR